MKAKILSIVLMLLVSGALLFSCGTSQTDQANSMDVNAVRTEAIQTYAAALTETLVAIPTASPTPTLLATDTPLVVTATVDTPIPANPCYKLLWLKDITIPDGTQMKAGDSFTKTWLVQNNGGCAWAPGFTFSNVGGESMQGKTVVLKDPVPVGAKYELSVKMVVPSGLEGLVQSSWRMADTNGSYFGDTLSVNIVVGNIVTATP